MLFYLLCKGSTAQPQMQESAPGQIDECHCGHFRPSDDHTEHSWAASPQLPTRTVAVHHSLLQTLPAFKYQSAKLCWDHGPLGSSFCAPHHEVRLQGSRLHLCTPAALTEIHW